ncbi:uncharacterized protein [Rhodnius prolixus]|uniref:uncharacterized protein n=1 Tax=Rhodnius prolixus TaxID=13249 RepID=UPI003D18CD41
MAKTYCIVFVISLFVMGDAFRLNQPDSINGFIYRKAGETRVIVHYRLALAARDARIRIITAEQRRCVENLLGPFFKEGNEFINWTTNYMMYALKHSKNTSQSDQKKAIDSAFGKIVDQWLPGNVAELNKC